MSKQNEDKEWFKPWMMWAIAILVCVAVWWFGAYLTRSYADSHVAEFSKEYVGLFGDSFGAINALISALAFAGVIVTFWLQRKELDLQRQELKAQREEFTQQNKTLKLQRFENTFFHMMELQQQIVNDLTIQLPRQEIVTNSLSEYKGHRAVNVEGIIRGRMVFAYIYWHKCGDLHDGVYDTIRIKGLEGYDETPYLEILDHYFRHLYTILRFIDETDAFDEDDEGNRDADYEFQKKYQYARTLRATLSRFELLVLYYNGLSREGKERLKPLIEKYALLNNLDRESLAISKEYASKFKIIRLEGWGKQYCLTGRDFEYYLTCEKDDDTKYYISAFGIREKELNRTRKSIECYEKMGKECFMEPVYLGNLLEKYGNHENT